MDAFHPHALAALEPLIEHRKKSGTGWLLAIFVAAVCVAGAFIVVLFIHFLGKG